MYEPNVKITPKIQDSLAEVEQIRRLLQTIPVLPSIVEEDIQNKALVETVHYTAKIEGNPLDIRAVEKLITNLSSQPPIDRPHEQEVVNLYRVMKFIREIDKQPDIPIDEKIIGQIHAFVVRNIPEQGTPGVYKTKPNEIRSSTTGERIYLPPSPQDTPQFMGDFNAWLSRTPLAFHPIITAGIAHLELVAIHPFEDGNGRTARALADLVLCRYGYGLRYLFSWVGQVGIDMGTYHETLQRVLGEQYGANVDPTTWLEYFAESIVKSLLEKKQMLTKMRDDFNLLHSLAKDIGMAEHQVDAIVYAIFKGAVTTGDYMRAAGCSRQTALTRLNELAEAEILEAVGKGRNARYIPAEYVREILSGEREPPSGVQLEMKIK